MRLSDLRASLTLAFLTCLTFSSTAFAQVGSGAIAYTGGQTEAFDTLASTGTSSSLPTGWYFLEASGTTTATYQADDGSLNQGNVMSYGSSGSSDRGFGVLPGNAIGSSGTLVADIGARITNFTGAPITSIDISFFTELWLYQGAVGERFAFEYSSDATSLTTGSWTAITTLDAVTPAVLGTGKKDGNLAVNRTFVSDTITGLNIAAGSDLWIRWRATNQSGNDNGLAIDEVLFGTPVDNPPAVVATAPSHNDTDVALDSTLTATFSEPVTASPGAFALNCSSAGSVALNVSGGPATFTLTPTASLAYNDSCTLTIAATSITDQDAPVEPMAADVFVDFDTEIDEAPELTASTPANGATDFQVNENLSLTFSEPVALGANWFQITCSISGSRDPSNVSVSGGPVGYSLDPNSDFITGENCTLTLDPGAITDQNGAINTLVDPGSIAFVPVADAPPTVMSTTPMDGNDEFPSAGDIVVLFSEPVTLSAGAFALTCDTSTGISLSHGMSGTSFTINTGTALVAGDSCTFTVDRTKVMDSGGNNLDADELVNFTVATSSTGTYYDTVNANSPEQLRCTLHEIIKDHSVFPYGWNQLEIADEAPIDVCAPGSASSENYILDVYRNRCYHKVTDRSGATGPGLYNREHTWPKSLGFGGDPDESKPPSTDLHMLHLSASDFNSHRGNKPYDNCDVGCTRDGTDANNGVGGTSADGDANWYDGSVFEVWDGMKGNMARAVMYMAIRYEGGSHINGAAEPDLELTDNLNQVGGSAPYMGKLSTLLQWSQQDPVDDRERDRNLVIYSFQGNRNPFIDHPEWATMALFTSSQPAVCEPNVSAVNANDDSYNATEDTLLSIAAPGVLDNDTADTSITGISVTDDVDHGVLSLSNDGSFSYTPSADYCGADSFAYQATDGSDTDTATVSLSIACVEDGDAPAQNDTLTVDEDAPVTFVDVLANDGVDPDPEQNPLSVAMVSNLSNGSSATIVAGGVEYTPGAGYCGNDSFDYTLAGGGSATVNVTIENCNNDAPNTMADGYLVAEDDSIMVSDAEGVLANDSDPEGDNLTAVLDNDADFGTLAFNSDGSFTYTPNPEFCGDDGFSYHANDGVNDSATTAATISVACLNDAPVANADSYNGSKNTLLQVLAPGVLENDTDVEMATLTAALDMDVQFGSLTLATNGRFDYTPNPEFCGEDSFTYHANDGSADSATVQVTLVIDCLNVAPVAVANSYFGSEDAPFSVIAAIGVLTNDSDANGDELTAVLDDDVQHGSLTLNADGSFDYAPDANHCGSDGFSYHANDGTVDSNIAAVTITVQCANDAPVSAGDAYAGTQDTTLSVAAPGVLANDSDVDAGDTLTAALYATPSHGSIDFYNDGHFDYTPTAGFCGADSFVYRVYDSEAVYSQPTTVTLTIACTSDAIFADGFE
ncbi:MAG: Ig-like domain-containing protein [Lysobacteraceae bacterium]